MVSEIPRSLHLQFLAKKPLKDFAGPAQRHRVTEDDLPWNLEVRQTLAAEVDKLAVSGRGIRFEYDDRHNFLAPQGIRRTQHRGIPNCRMRVQNFLDLARIDIEPSDNQHVFLAVHDVEVAVLVNLSQ